MSECTILFLAANPEGTDKLALDNEIREIEAKLRASDFRDSLQLISHWAVRRDDLLQFLNQHKPHVVHFSGHGSKANEILLSSDTSLSAPVGAAALRELFRALKGNIRLVVLNACFSRDQAAAIVEHIDCAVGMNQAVGDQAAIVFAASFYRALGFGRSIQQAFDQGKAALMLAGIPEENTPELLCRPGVDPNDVILVQAEEPRRMSKGEEAAADRSIKIGQGVTGGSVIISGDGNVVTITSGADTSGGRQNRDVPKVFISPSSEYLTTYRDWLKRKCADIELLGVHLKQGQSIGLSDVYVPLVTTMDEVNTPPLRRNPQRFGRRAGPHDESRERGQLLLEQLDKYSLYVPGDPGTGKSTFCLWVAWLVAAGALPTAAVAADAGYVESFPATLKQRLPLLVPLRDLWHYLPDDARRNSLSQAEFEAVLGRWLDTTRLGGLDWNVVAPHLKQGTALLILDGVDEVPLRQGDERRTYYPRATFLSGLIDAAPAWQQLGNRLLVTSRPHGIDDPQWRNAMLREAPICQLDEASQTLLARRWFRKLKDDPEKAKQTAAEMMRHLAQRRKLAKLTTNPLLLTAMCVIYDGGARLPQDKYDLYLRIVDNVLRSRYRDDLAELEMAREHLSVLAHGMHTGAGLGQKWATPRAEASHQEIERMIRTYHDASIGNFSGYKDGLETRDELLQRSGLLSSHGDQKAAFYHFTFQEFLAARRIFELEREQLFEIFCERSATTDWHNTLSFLFSCELADSQEDAVALLNRLIEQLTPDALKLALVVADCVDTMRCRNNRLQSDIEERFKRFCLLAIDEEVEIKARRAMGLALGRLGDPRVVDDLHDLSAYVRVPEGEYVYQRGAQSIEQSFLLSKYPVTNSQFAIFKNEGGYNERSHWSRDGWDWKEDTGISAPRYWRDARFNAPNQPVVGVSFYEAEAFCAWAEGFLPTEQQWEAAARGWERRQFPWGDDWEDGICNSQEAGLRVTSPVGMFPRSRSLEFEMEDMAGNVWEWCNSKWKPGSRSCVLRGGSFYFDAEHAQSDYRFNYEAIDRLNNIGFRAATTYD